VEVEAKHSGSGKRQWALLLGPIFAAYGQQQMAYGFVTWACSRNARVLVHVPTVLAIAVITVCAVGSMRTLQRVGTGWPDDGRSSIARARFMAWCSVTLCAFASLLVIAQWLPTLFIPPCTQ
jgi:hypothetical protein